MSVHPAPADATAADQSALGPLVARAQAAARAGGEPVLLSYTAPLGCDDPLNLLRALDEAVPDPAGNGVEPSPFRFYWEQPSSGLALAAGGVTQRITGQGEGRFQDAATQLAAALETAVSGGSVAADAGPYVLGGFSYFDHLDDAHWPGFGPAQLVVPHWLAVHRGGDCLAVVTARVDALANPQSVVAHLCEGLRRLRQAAAAVPGAVPAHPWARPGGGAAPVGDLHPASGHAERERWIDMVRNARGQIRAGKLSKVVLARTLDLVCEAAPSPLRLLHWLRAAYAGCYSFLVDPGAGSVFLGATPERIARVQGGRVRLAALAGSMPRGETPEADAALAQRLLDSPKERAEHRIVVEGIVEAVRPLGAVHWDEEPTVLKYANVQHLYTAIELTPRTPLPLLALLDRLHPTAAVGGFPRAEAASLIRECEGFERGWYAAPVGWMNARGDGEFAVALRSGRITGRNLRLFAGGGIVADSEPEREYEETEIKLEPLLAALAAQNGRTR